MKYLQLFTNNQQQLGSDGIMTVDGRFNAYNIKQTVIKRNNSFKKNFPHKVATSFAIYNGRIGSSLSSKISL